jgi:hypothetical protein
MKVRYTTTANLANELFRGHRRSPAHPGAQPLQQDRPALSRRAGQCRAEFFTDREGRSAVAVASNARSPNGVKPSVTSGSAPRSSTG